MKTENMSPTEIDQLGAARQYQSDEPCFPSPSVGSITQRMFNLGLNNLCPICGSDFTMQDAYRPIPEMPPVSMDMSMPYHNEKPPSMQAFIAKSYSPNAVESEQQPPLYCDQPYTALPQPPGFDTSGQGFSPSFTTAETPSSQGFSPPFTVAEIPSSQGFSPLFTTEEIPSSQGFSSPFTTAEIPSSQGFSSPFTTAEIPSSQGFSPLFTTEEIPSSQGFSPPFTTEEIPSSQGFSPPFTAAEIPSSQGFSPPFTAAEIPSSQGFSPPFTAVEIPSSQGFSPPFTAAEIPSSQGFSPPFTAAEIPSSLGQGFIGPSIKAESPSAPDALVFQPEHPLDTPVPVISYSQNVTTGSGREVVFHKSEDPSSISSQRSVLPSQTTTNRSYPASREHGVPSEHLSNFDILQPNQRGGKRGPFKDPSLREQTAQTRKIGSCIRCRMQRIRCEHNDSDPTGPCLTCKKVANTRAGRFPCLRYKITDVKLYKPGQVPGYEWSKRWNDTVPASKEKWASSEIKIIQISEGFSDHKLEVLVKKFIPQEGDKLDRSWYHNGEKKSVAIPPFALVELETVKAAYISHIHRSMNQAFPKIVGPKGLIFKTYKQSVELCKKGTVSTESLELLRDTFRLWMAVRLSTTSSFIVGDETLGMPKDILDETNPHPGTIPIPPVLGAQLDLILIQQIQSQLRRQVLDRLEKMVSKRKHTTWMVTYLVTFVLLHNAALITAHDAGYARKHGMNRRFAREAKVKEYHAGANTLLAYFHYCNKNVHPFSAQCKDQDLRTLAGLEDEQIRFVRHTRAYANQHREEWAGIRARGEVENDYYFVSQLFDEDWEVQTTI